MCFSDGWRSAGEERKEEEEAHDEPRKMADACNQHHSERPFARHGESDTEVLITISPLSIVLPVDIALAFARHNKDGRETGREVGGSLRCSPVLPERERERERLQRRLRCLSTMPFLDLLLRG